MGVVLVSHDLMRSSWYLRVPQFWLQPLAAVPGAEPKHQSRGEKQQLHYTRHFPWGRGSPLRRKEQGTDEQGQCPEKEHRKFPE